MKPIVIYSDKILSAISILFRVGGLSVFPFVVLREYHRNTERGTIILNHETIHFRQTVETLVVGFYVVYVVNYLINLLIYRHPILAYKNLLFEREAYSNQTDLTYCDTRRWFSWIRKTNYV